MIPEAIFESLVRIHESIVWLAYINAIVLLTVIVLNISRMWAKKRVWQTRDIVSLMHEYQTDNNRLANRVTELQKSNTRLVLEMRERNEE